MTDEYYIVERIIRNISHEIKNPLTIMKGYTQLLSTDINDAASVKKSQRMVLEQIERINKTFDHLYSMFSAKIKEKDDIDIVEVLNNYVHDTTHTIPGRVHFYTDIKYHKEICDKEKLERLLYCICEGFDWKNNPGVCLDVSLEKNATTGLTFTFRGIDFSQVLENIFYLPFSSKQYYNTGTELYEVYCITQSHGWVFSAHIYPPDSVFTITF
jgi:two-component system, sporulation sensor kinase B